MRQLCFYWTLMLMLCAVSIQAQQFRFALITDTHINVQNAQATEDLTATINEINTTSNIDFVLVAGDVSDRGDSASLLKARELFNKLKAPYYITFGNHDILTAPVEHKIYLDIFGSDRFAFQHKGIYFIGFTSCPQKQYGVGHVADLNWVDSTLSKIDKKTPIIALTHYPLQKGDIDNWNETIEILEKYNTQAVLNGHYHRNALLMYKELPGIVNRSNLRKNLAAGGYSIYAIDDFISVSEKIIGDDAVEWMKIPIEQKTYNNTKN